MKNPLGSPVVYSNVFDPQLLYPIARAQSRVEIGVREPLPFEGRDRLRCFEMSWLSEATGVPQVGIASIEYPASSKNLIELKSLNLFLASLNFTPYRSAAAVAEVVRCELARALESDGVAVSIASPEQWAEMPISVSPGICIDGESIDPATSGRLRSDDSGEVEETLSSNLLRSLCPVTGQPDWGTVVVRYRGKKLLSSSFVNYLIAHRSYQGFHEQCCERIFADVAQATAPSELWVGCFYTRRGGIDSSCERWLPTTLHLPSVDRLVRQ